MFAYVEIVHIYLKKNNIIYPGKKRPAKTKLIFYSYSEYFETSKKISIETSKYQSPFFSVSNIHV